jgi:ABC-type polysaccharide transport system permease subunit
MNNIVIALIIAIAITFFVVITENKKEERKSIGVRTFITSFFVSFVALTYLVNDGFSAQDIDTGDPNF